MRVFLVGAILAGGCFSAPPAPSGEAVDPEFALTTTAARSAFERGVTVEAIALYRRALARARAMDDAARIGDAAYDLGACHLQAGQLDEARAALREAEAETLRAAGPSGGGANLADVLLLEATAAKLAGRPAEALGFADRVLRDAASRPTPGTVARVHALKGEIACDANDGVAGARELASAERVAGASPSATIGAALAGLDARVRLLRGDFAGGAALLDRQADRLRSAGHYREMAAALARAGGAWADAGSPANAADRLFRAARASAGQSDPAGATRLLDLAEASARKEGDAGPLARIEQLRAELNDHARPGADADKP